MKRVQHHFTLASLTLLPLGVAALIGPGSGIEDRLSIVSAYLCLVLLACTMLIGSARLMGSGRPVTNIYLRRDMGIWSALVGLLHFVLANMLSMNAAYMDQFVSLADTPSAVELRDQLYFWGTILGYFVAVVFLLLLALSSDVMLKLVGPRWWKRLQRSAYFAFVFTVVHAFAFQMLESRQPLLVGVVVLVLLLALAGQIFGIAVTRTRPASASSR